MRGELLVGFLFCMVWGWGLVGGATPALGDQCGAAFQKVISCLTFATGKADTPTKECCASVADIKEKNPVCLCYIIQQIHSGSNDQIKNLGVQEARLLQLPSACKLNNASSAECPQLLHLAPNSPDAAIFTNSSASTTPGTNAPATTSGTSSPTKGDEKSNGFPNAVPHPTGLLAIAMAIFFYAC